MSKHTKGRHLQISDNQDGKQSVTATEIETIDHFGLMLPSAAELMGYENACPGAADRILTLTEKQFEHRVESEKNQQKNDNEFRAMGVVVGLMVIFVFAVIAIIFAFFFGKQVEALAAIITPMVVLLLLS
jgi:uncharacterized membrane protein